jgi:hypothetical protein
MKMAEPKTYTEEQVSEILAIVRGRERITAALLTAIQRSRMAGDDPVYTAALESVLNAYNAPPQPQEPEAKPDEPAAG